MKTVFESFDDYASADRAVRKLEERGFDSGDISVVGPESILKNNGALRQTNGAEVTNGADVAEGAGDGAIKGGLAGLAIGAAALALPGVGPLFVAGTLASLVTSTAAGATAGAATGGLHAALTEMGVGDNDARSYESRVGSGEVLVSVRSERMDDEARDIMRAAKSESALGDTHRN